MIPSIWDLSLCLLSQISHSLYPSLYLLSNISLSLGPSLYLWSQILASSPGHSQLFVVCTRKQRKAGSGLGTRLSNLSFSLSISVSPISNLSFSLSLVSILSSHIYVSRLKSLYLCVSCLKSLTLSFISTWFSQLPSLWLTFNWVCVHCANDLAHTLATTKPYRATQAIPYQPPWSLSSHRNWLKDLTSAYKVFRNSQQSLTRAPWVALYLFVDDSVKADPLAVRLWSASRCVDDFTLVSFLALFQCSCVGGPII